ncbi:MAG: EAL domain-containing protein [Gammaproteobacteria bacterium]|nr:MAG: EAL domain-containing protein [Gammaproteobacteria bacterium]
MKNKVNNGTTASNSTDVSTAAALRPGNVITFLARLRLNSIRGRYLAAAMLFLFLLLGAGWYAEQRVERVTYQGEKHLSERAQIRALLRDLTNDIWNADRILQGYLLVPDDNLRARLGKQFDSSLDDARKLASFGWIQGNDSYREPAEKLVRSLARLKKETATLADVRSNPEKLYPAFPLMITRMLPAYTDFYTAATLAMDHALEVQKTSSQGDVYRQFADVRHRTTLMTSTFRNYVIYRFGIFGDPEKTMRTQSHDMGLYLSTINQLLNDLADQDRRGHLDFVQQDSLEKMRESHKQWVTAYRDVSAIITSERWRTDTPLLRDNIDPLFNEAWDALRALDAGVEAYAVQDLAAFAGIADSLSRSIWWLAAGGMLVVTAGFLLFELAMRRPIANVTRALRAEAEGHAPAAIPATTAQEIQDLVVAFDHMRHQVHSRQERLQTVLDNAGEGIITFDARGMIQQFNRAAEKLFGWTESEVVGAYISQLVASEQSEKREDYLQHFLRAELRRLINREGEVTGRYKDGSTFPMALKITEMSLEGKTLYIGMVSDISERKAMLQHLKDMAEHDGLTGLYNRTFFQEELERVVERVQRDPGQCAALLYIDLDNFKYVNDTLGHAAGDRVLLEISSILHKRLRKTDMLARLGGDEFAVLLYNARHDVAAQAAEALRQRLAEYAFRERGEAVDIGCSIGVTLVTGESKSAEEALSQADLACYLAKRGGRNRVHMFDPADATNAETMSLDMGWSRRIKEAIEHSRFALACQPIVNTRSGVIESFEVLIRMRDEDGATIMPGGFLPAADRFGLSTDIDKWVIVHAIEALASQRAVLPQLRYSINLTGSTLGDLRVCNLIQEQLRRHQLDPAALTFEVTETVAIADIPVAEAFLSRLQAIGCKTALDDFGSGMASFAYLKDLPVDIVKIDGRFVRNVASNTIDQAMVKAMNDIAHALCKQTVGEFVESEECLKTLTEIGVDYAQGYFLGRPDITYPCEAIAEKLGVDGLCLLPPARLN